jgi:hypothetical protein
MGSELESARARVVNLELEPIRSYFRTGRSDEGLDEPSLCAAATRQEQVASRVSYVWSRDNT